MNRAPNWPDLLVRFIEDRRGNDFEWGLHDCCMFAADWVMEATGKNLAQHFLATYSSARTAATVLRVHGGLAEIVSSTGLVRWQQPAMAQRGDVALVHNNKRDALCVVSGDALVGPAPHGLTFLPLSHAQAAWKV